jgi:hypothetical protein
MTNKEAVEKVIEWVFSDPIITQRCFRGMDRYLDLEREELYKIGLRTARELYEEEVEDIALKYDTRLRGLHRRKLRDRQNVSLKRLQAKRRKDEKGSMHWDHLMNMVSPHKASIFALRRINSEITTKEGTVAEADLRKTHAEQILEQTLREIKEEEYKKNRALRDVHDKWQWFREVVNAK